MPTQQDSTPTCARNLRVVSSSTMKRISGSVLAITTMRIAAAFLVSGCVVGYWGYSAAGGGKDAALGEQRTYDFAKDDALNALHSDGVLFDTKPDDSVVTHWQDADTPASMWGSVVGVHPQYHYQIE